MDESEDRAEREAWRERMSAKAEAAHHADRLTRMSSALEGLQRAAARRIHLTHEAAKAVREAVARARGEGVSWNTVGHALGTTGEVARQRYSAV